MSWLAVSIVQPNLMGTLAGALGGAAGLAATEPAAGLAGAVLATGAAAWPHAARPRPARARLVWRNVRRETWAMTDLLRPTHVILRPQAEGPTAAAANEEGPSLPSGRQLHIRL